ncbi:MAG: ATP-binding protein [Candidatus Marinimicrobia bacterium]|nr:ATP-binding protein [Candidatus Neomarinimicrobiota bacterium]MBT3764008.1 ATP-binding protein [Candidatus Neomarinimicrobiota bacterium]MBT4053891.1 ATP-binding protein [Candidatus Neomarinimicrobiota bacterium]MBT4635727.1 ATP-binding protein [Candidatus Neomarinimicrobiota bacterium]MBT5386831.1 ATP-binding protein [Candidatus Neomarinimicrobiota bacterium]
MIDRKNIQLNIEECLKSYPVTLILGPRQCGKTTLARVMNDRYEGSYFDLEDPGTPLQPERAGTILRELNGLVVIDECQRQPKIFDLLRVLSDREKRPATFLLTGSASPSLVRGVSESMAGRVVYVNLGGFNISELKMDQTTTLWLRGGLPPSFLGKNNITSYEWRKNYIRSLLERDIPQLGIRIPSQTLYRFWMMVAHYHGKIWNASDFSRAMGVKEDTARKYLDILTGAFIIRQLQPWYVNIGKRVVKSPKIYVRDTGLLHAFLGLESIQDVTHHPQLGFSWEGFVIEQILALTHKENEAYFYKTHAGAELDLLIKHKGRNFGFEIKYQDAPSLSKSMIQVFHDLNLEKLWVIYPGKERYTLKENIEVLPFKMIQHALSKMIR